MARADPVVTDTPDISTVVDYVGASAKRLNMVFQFEVVNLGQGKVFKYTAKPFNFQLEELKEAINTTQSFLTDTDGWTTSFVENHDQARCKRNESIKILLASTNDSQLYHDSATIVLSGVNDQLRCSPSSLVLYLAPYSSTKAKRLA